MQEPKNTEAEGSFFSVIPFSSFYKLRPVLRKDPKAGLHISSHLNSTSPSLMHLYLPLLPFLQRFCELV